MKEVTHYCHFLVFVPAPVPRSHNNFKRNLLVLEDFQKKKIICCSLESRATEATFKRWLMMNMAIYRDQYYYLTCVA